MSEPTTPHPDAAPSPADGRFPTMSALPTLRERPLAEHADVYAQLHAELQAALADIDGA